MIVYFAQLTTVRLNDLTQQASALLNFNMLGYALMALATLFAGLTIELTSKKDKWLRYMFMIHGIFFISCLIVPMLGRFKADSQSSIGIALLEL